ncbi:hypothetical protein Hanom_Chr05g00469891 [Helianthus anomalus]
MFVYLTKQTKFVFVCLINELPAKRFTNCSLKVLFVCSPKEDPMTISCPNN